MPKTTLRQFTGGLSNEIDPQNLREDQGEESLDINLKGFALEPGEGTAPISGGHYYYRGEWIKDSKAVSFEESGIGVVKTYNEKRPEFEEIIKDAVNVSRKLGPPLAPTAVINGTVVSEGTRGERPAEGSHLLKLPETALGEVDKVVGTTPAPSLKTYEADSTTLIDDIHYYNSQAYWLVKSGSSWTVKTRAWSSTLSEFTGVDISSPACTHNSAGSFFKAGYFVCWDNQFIDSVQLDNVSMSGSKFDTVETTNPSDGGDAGAQGYGDNAGGNFTSGASSSEITGVDIDGTGIISFSQRITTANTIPTAYTHSPNERWLRTPSGSHGCFVVFLRDGMAHADSESPSGSAYDYKDENSPAPIVFTDKNKDVFPAKQWESLGGGITYKETRWTSPGITEAQITESIKKNEARVQKTLDALGDIDFGVKYAVVFAKNDAWVRVRYQDPVSKPPEMFVIKCTSSGSDKKTKDIGITRILTATNSLATDRFGYYGGLGILYWNDVIDVELTFNAITGNNKIHWKYTAPIGDDTRQGSWRGTSIRTKCSSYERYDVQAATIMKPRIWYWSLVGTQINTNGTHAHGGQSGSWVRYIGSTGTETKKSWLVKNGAADGSYKNNITTPVVPGKMNRLCSYVRGGAMTQQGAFSVSELWTTATFASADDSISFAEATTKNFRAGDYIKIGQNRTNKSMHLNLSGIAKKVGGSSTGEQTFITAKIISVGAGKLILAPPELKQNKQGDKKTYLDEECFPLISGFIEYNKAKKITYDKPDGGPVCSVIKSELSSHVLVGHGYHRTYDLVRLNYAATGTYDVIEVRLAGAVPILATALINYTHRISWTGGDYRTVSDGAGGTVRKRIPHEVRAVEYLGTPRIFYTKGNQTRKLYSQKGSGADVPAQPVPLSLSGSYHVDKDYLTHIDDKGITIYTPDLLTKPFVKANPTLSDGLGLTGNVTDARTFVDNENAVYVCVKIGGYWKLVQTSDTGPSVSLLSYDFKKPIGFDGTKLWGIAIENSGWDIQYATPFFESHIIGSWIFFANSYTTVTPTISAWGQVVDFRIGEKGENGTPRYLSVDWKMDSGNYFGTGTPTIGLNHEANKMIVENTFKWYPVQNTFNLITSGTGTVIADLSYQNPSVANTHRPLAVIEIPFESKVFRDIVFFKQSETMLPIAGTTGGESRITFVNYNDPGQSFYVLSDNVFKVVKRIGVEPEDAYRLGQAVTGGTAFDASKIGISTFLIGAPNMYNGYGPNIDLYYRASFVNKWGHESAPSPLPSKGITSLDSADDCVQVNFNAPFFRLTDTDIDTIRLYRYGGDSSEFLFLKDIPMPTLPFTTEVINGVTVKIPYFPTISGINSVTNGFSRKSAISPYYLLKTTKDISSLSGFTNSNFLLTATPSSLDGSWRVNQVSENSSPSLAYTSLLIEDLNTTGTTVKLNPITKTWVGTTSATWAYASSPNHGLVHEQLVTFSTTGTFPTVNGYNNSGGNYYGQAITDDREFYIILSYSSDPTNEFQIADKAKWEASGATYPLDGYGTGVHSVHSKLSYSFPATGVVKLKEEYISYAAISSSDLTGCVRGIHGTNASDHKSGQVKAITVTAGGTNYGNDTGAVTNIVFSTDVAIDSFTNVGGNIQVNVITVAPGEAFIEGGAVLLKTTGSLPAGLSTTSIYYVRIVGTPSGSYEFNLATTPSGTPIAVTGTDLGSGTHSYNSCIIHGTGGGGTGFYATYGVNTSTGAITNVTVVNSGSGYTSNPTLVVNDPGSAVIGSGATFTITTGAGVTANIVEWELEMEHRNQDTTTLTEAISSPLTGTANVVKVSDTIVFPAPATKTIQSATNNAGLLITSNAHGLEDNDLITVSLSFATITGLSVSANYYIIYNDVNTFRIALTSSGTAITYSGSTTGSHSMVVLPKILIGNEILAYTGKTSTTFTGVTPAIKGTIASTHGLNVVVRSYDESYSTTTVTNASIEIEGFGFRDKARTPISSLYEMQTDNWPPLGLEYNVEKKQFFETESEDDYFRYIKAVGSMYFGALDANLRFSKYGTPEYWPISAVITLDSEIRCIEEHAGEGLVFTTNSLYRVRGTDPKAMIAFRVPDARGLPAGYEHTVSDFNGGLIWLTASDGICMYSAGRATYLTRDKHDIGRLKAPYSCVVDGVYWLFQEPGSGTGYRLELSTGEIRLAQTTIEAYYAYFAKALGVGVVVTKDDSINSDDVISLTGSTTANGDATVTVSSTDNLTAGMLVTGDGIPVNTTILSVTSPTVFELSANATADATATVTLNFPLFQVEEIGGDKAKNIEWRSKKIDAGEPAIPKALGSVAIVYEALNSNSAETIVDGIRGQALTAELLGLDPDDLDAGNIATAESETTSDLYSIFTKYDEPNQTFVVDTGGANLTNTERRTILMPEGFNTSTVTVGDRVWNELLADNTEVESLTTTTISSVVYPSIVLNKEPLRIGTGTIYWGNLPIVEIYLNNDDTPSRVFTLPPGDVVEPQSMDLYLKDLKRFRTISVAIQGDVRVQSLSLRHYPLQKYQSSTLHHSADIFYKGDIDFRVMLDGSLVYRKELSNAGDDFKEERIYLPASSFGQRAHYMNESRAGMIESVNFNGSVAA